MIKDIEKNKKSSKRVRILNKRVIKILSKNCRQSVSPKEYKTVRQIKQSQTERTMADKVAQRTRQLILLVQ